MPDRTCSVGGCEEQHYARSFCQPHYGRARNAGQLPPVQEYHRRPSDTSVCEVPECGKRWYAAGLCRMHYARKRQYGSTDLPTKAGPPPKTCTVTGCGSPSRQRGWCGKHYARWYKHGDPVHNGDPVRYTDEICLVASCDRPAKTRDRCQGHYTVWRRTGRDSPPKINLGKTCSVEGCAKLAELRGRCEMHDARIRRWGDPHHVPDRSVKDHILAYHGAHTRVRYVRGPARDLTCVDCGGPAKDWAYDHTCPRERTGEEGMPFSPDPFRYRPMCRKCHVAFDMREAGHGLGELDSA